MEEKSLKETLAEVAKNLEELKQQKKIKKWSLPFFTRFGMGKKRKRMGYVVFVNIGTNKAITFIKAPISDGVALVNNVPHIVEPDDILLWKNKIPMVLQPQWSERPFSPKDHFAKAETAGQNTAGLEYIMNFILKTQIQAKKNFPTGLIIIGVIAIIGLGWYLIKSGAFKQMSRVNYNLGDEVIEIVVRDSSGAKLEVRRSNISNSKENGKWLTWLIKKWGLKFDVDKSYLDMDNEFFKF